MKTIEERANLAAWQIYEETILSEYSVDRVAEIIEEKINEQKVIDDKLYAGVWVKIDADHPLPYGQEVIGYNKEWVHEDFNPSGTRIGFLNDIGFISAKWVNDHDCYTTCSEEGDDYTIYKILPDGTRKTWCKYENGKAIEGYLPNMPTHFMLIPKTPDGFTWPYNTEKKI